MIDVIIPVYNVENYIERCVNSLLNQTYMDYRILLIDDDSTDNSGKICNELAERNEKVIFYSIENKGIAAARNFGLQISTADIITFVDSDDFVDAKYLERLLKAMEKADADLLISGLTDVWDSTQIKVPDENEIIETPKRGEVIRRIFAQEVIDVSPCAKLYKRKLFDNIKYPEGEIYEDMKVIIKLLEAADKIAVTSYSGYYYYQRSGSIMHSEMSRDRVTLMETMEKYVGYVKERYPEAADAVKMRYIRCGFHVMNRAMFASEYKEYAMKLRETLCNNRGYILKSGNFKSHEKIAVILLGINVNLYKMMLGSYRKGLK